MFSGWDFRRQFGLVVILPLCALPLMFDVRLAVVLVAGAIPCAAAIAAGLGFRVTIDEHGAHVVKHWVGVPYRSRTIPLGDVEMDLYQALEEREPEGCLLRTRDGALAPGERRWIFGHSKNAVALAAALRAEIEAARSRRAKTYRT